MEEAERHHVFRLLDRNLKRSPKLGKWESLDVIDYEYWEIRYTLPELMMKGYEDIYLYFSSKYSIKNVKLADKVSFYFWLKDELQNIAKMEIDVLSPRVISKSNIKPSPRAKDYYYLVELYGLSGGCPIKGEEIKKMKYSIVFETLMAKVIDSEKEWKSG